MAGWQRLREEYEKVLLIDGDGTEFVFNKSNDGGYSSPTGDFSTLEKLEDGRFQRTMTDGMKYVFDTRGFLATVTDRNNNATTYEYTNEGLLDRILDPVNLATVFGYEEGKVSTITDAMQRVTRLEYDDQGNLIRIVDPDASKREWSYDSKHLLIGETNKLGDSETTNYDANKMVMDVVRPDESVIEIQPVLAQGLDSPSMTFALNTAPSPDFDFTSTATIVDGNGNIQLRELDRLGQLAASADEVGSQITIQRDFNNQVSRIVDGNGNLSRFLYDGSGNLVNSVDAVGLSVGPSPINSQLFPSRTIGGAFGYHITADFNNDGHADILTGRDFRQGNGERLWLGNGDGVFPDSILVAATPSRTNARSVVDFDQNGLLDLVTATKQFTSGRTHRELQLHLGIGDGRFADAETVYAGDGAFREFASGDLNRDGHGDLIGYDWLDRLVVGWFSNETGTLIGPTTLATIPSVSSIELHDFDEDDILDILIAGDDLYLARGVDGSNNFQFETLSTAAGVFSGAWGGDIDGDDQLDVVASYAASGGGGVRLLRGNSEGGFETLTDFSLSYAPGALAVADANGDGLLDIAVGGDHLAIMTNMGDALFSSVSEYPTPIYGDLAIADLNEDGRVEFVGDYIVHTDENLRPIARTIYNVGDLPTDAKLADADGDGNLDIVSTNLDRDALTILWGDGTGDFTMPVDLPAAVDPRVVLVGDVNEDQLPDLVHTGDSGELTLLLNEGNRSFSAPGEIPQGVGAIVPAFGDFNGDQHLDIAITLDGPPRVTLVEGVGDGTFRVGESIELTERARRIKVADLNADGHADLLLGGYRTPAIYYGDGTGAFPTQVPLAVSGDLMDFDAADLNGDDILDVLVVGSSGDYLIYTSSGDNYTSSFGTFSVPDRGTGPVAFELTDINRDGFIDIVGILGALYVAPGDGTGHFDTTLVYDADHFVDYLQEDFSGRAFQYAHRLTLGDIDHDGDSDVVSIRSHNGELSIIPNLSDGEQTARPGVNTTYDSLFSQPLTRTDELGRVTSRTIDPLNGNTLTITQPGSLTTSLTYKSDGLPETTIDPEGRQSEFRYDSRGRAVEIIFAQGTADEASQRFGYDDVGNQTDFWDENDNHTQFVYDEMNRLLEIIEPDPDGDGPLTSPTTLFAYDAAGNLETTTDARQNLTTNEYDQKNQGDCAILGKMA